MKRLASKGSQHEFRAHRDDKTNRCNVFNKLFSFLSGQRYQNGFEYTKM